MEKKVEAIIREIKSGSNAGTNVSWQVQIPKSLQVHIKNYQDAFRECFNKKPPKKSELLVIVAAIGSDRLKKRTAELKAQASENPIF
jgi:hypothetical protein